MAFDSGIAYLKKTEKIICSKYPSFCTLTLLYMVLNNRQCRSSVTIPITASVLSAGCRRAAQCANEARVPVSMVTSPRVTPSSSPSQCHRAGGGQGKEVEARKEHFQGEAWEIRVGMLCLWPLW